MLNLEGWMTTEETKADPLLIIIKAMAEYNEQTPKKDRPEISIDQGCGMAIAVLESLKAKGLIIDSEKVPEK